MNSVKRILFINDVGDDYAGSELSLYQFLEDLNRREFEPVVLCYSGGKWAEKIRALNIQVIVRNLGHYRRSRSPFILVQQFFKLLSSVQTLTHIIRDERIALVHVNKTSSAPVAILSAKRAAVPCVWHVRSFAKNLGLVARYFVGACSRLLFVSKAARKPYESAFPQFSKKFEVLYNRVNLKVALDEKDILKKELGLSHETPLVGMIAHFVSWKKHDDFLKCASEIMKVMPQVRFVIAGGTLDSNPQEEKAKNDYKLKLASIFNQYQLSGRVFFLGQRYDVNNIFPDLDTLVIPSQFETFGRVAVEAACFGVPLVAYRGGGLPEIFLDQQEIIFVNPADIQALAEGVLSLLKSPQKKETQIKKAREKALKFTSDESVRSLEKIYRELLGASS